jgi:hypothetical protein
MKSGHIDVAFTRSELLDNYLIYLRKMAHPTGFEPTIFRRTPVRVNLALVV